MQKNYQRYLVLIMYILPKKGVVTVKVTAPFFCYYQVNERGDSVNYPYTYMPYNTYGFNPYQQQQIPQQIQQPEPQQIQKRSNCEWIFVNGMQQVKEHIVQPNQTFYFLDNNDPVLYEKKADNLGSSQIKAYRMTEVNPNEINQSGNINVPDVTKDDINALAARISQLEQQMQVKEAIVNESISKQSDYAVNNYTSEYKPAGSSTEYPYQ
jgi:hypothetical protein